VLAYQYFHRAVALAAVERIFLDHSGLYQCGLCAVMTTAAAAPLVSVIWNGYGQTAAALENIVALQAQSHPHFELLLVDDGPSTDDSREALRAIVANDDRIKLLPRIALNSGESLLYLLRRCRGDYVAICPNEGHFGPDALQFAVVAFQQNPQAGMVCGENFLIDAHGKSLPQVDVVTLLFTPYRPFLSAGFFRRRALLDVGVNDEKWLFDSIELELCLRVACDFGVRSLRHKVVACMDASGQDDGLPKNPASALEDRLQLITRAFSVEGFWGANEALRLESKANHAGMLWEQYRCLGLSGMEPLAFHELRAVSQQFDLLLRNDHRILRNLHRLFCTRSHNFGLFSTPLQKLFGFASRQPGRMAIHIPYQLWNATFGIGSWLKRKVLMLTFPCSDHHPAAPSREEMFADLYAEAAARHEARGQIDLALEMFKLAEPLKSADVDSVACQALLKLPVASDQMIASFQANWVQRHVGPQKAVDLVMPNIPEGTRKIRLGYHCSFMASDTIRFMMRDVLRAHDRTRFEIYGYAPQPLPDDIKASFDVVRDTAANGPSYAQPIGGPPAISDDAFVSLVRSDQIDVLVELTGFSMGNRFSAMSRRAAPIQVSFLNHTGSSHVPNVDYILADEIAVPEADQPLYSERVQHLPNCFFCFDYRDSKSPPIADPPAMTRGYATFGCFGSGGKLNKQLIAMWADLLHRCPTAILHLQNAQLNSYDCRHFLSSQFRNLGISHDRLILARGISRKDLLETYNHIDISLDTWPYCGGNTIAESLWMGVPVVSLKGDRFSSRYGASLLAAAGCQNLVAETPEEYIEIVAGLAADLPRLQSLRQNLRQMSVDHGLGDSQRFARDLEEAYVEMLGNLGLPAEQGASRHNFPQRENERLLANPASRLTTL
jgi:hypothetical protein